MSQLNLLIPKVESLESNQPVSKTGTSQLKSEPLDFSSLIGQSIAHYLLSNAIATNRIAPAYLFAGPEGVGKELAARIFSAQLLGTQQSLSNHPDLLMIEPTFQHQGKLIGSSMLEATEQKQKYPPFIRIEQIRELIQFLSYSAQVATRKIAIVRDAHAMTLNAANALLKALEELKSGTVILLSSRPQQLLPTIVSRSQSIPFGRLNSDEMFSVLTNICRADILNNSVVLSLAAGSPGQAIAHFRQLQSIPQALLSQLSSPPNAALAAIQLAKEIDTALEYHQQIWLLDNIQHSWWHRYHDVTLIEKVESAKTALTKMVSSRLVWDTLLLPSNNADKCC